MICLLAFMLYLDFQNAAETGEELNTVGVIAARIAVTVASSFFLWLRKKPMRATSNVLEKSTIASTRLAGINLASTSYGACRLLQ